MSNLSVSREQLAQFIPNHDSVRVFERLFESVAGTPSTIDEAATQASNATALAQQALGMLSLLAEALDRLDTAPSAEIPVIPGDTAPAIGFGSLGTQDATAVEIAGGIIDNAPIGATTAATGRFSTLTATGTFGCNGKAPQAAMALGPAATDLPTALDLINNIRAALIANGIGS